MSDEKRSEPPPSDRRVEPRHFACFPAHIQRSGGSLRMALIRDLSVSGALLLTRQKLDIGETIGLSLYLSEESEKPRIATGHVVRVEARSAEKSEVWLHSVAVHFDEPLADCEAEIKELEQRQAELGLPHD